MVFPPVVIFNSGSYSFYMKIKKYEVNIFISLCMASKKAAQRRLFNIDILKVFSENF